MNKQHIVIAANTNVAWKFSLGSDPVTIARQDRDLPEPLAILQAMVTGRNNMYVLSVPAYGVELAMPCNIWDPHLESQGFTIPSQEAAAHLIEHALMAFLKDPDCAVNPTGTAELGKALARGTALLQEETTVYGFPGAVNDNILSDLNHELAELEAQQG